jgi:hypothetical protein
VWGLVTCKTESYRYALLYRNANMLFFAEEDCACRQLTQLGVLLHIAHSWGSPMNANCNSGLGECHRCAARRVLIAAAYSKWRLKVKSGDSRSKIAPFGAVSQVVEANTQSRLRAHM